ncbi:cache domain-containing protein [Wukongibacter baidiensis]|uniref:cache domain-containing protein n=1 Tax=Wukongibacter baidiensis TaxID=1723361 RepID=UPI003D7F5FE9
MDKTKNKYFKIIAMVIISIIPTIAASYLFLTIDNQSSVELTLSSLNTMGTDYNRQINEWIEDIIFDLNYLAYSESVKTLKQCQMENLIDYIKINKDIYKEIYVLDKDHNIIYGHQDIFEDFTQKTWIKNSFKGNVDTSDVLFYRNYAVMEIAVPIMNKKTVVGSICARVKLDHLNDIMANSILIDKTVKTYIVDKDGTFITESRYYPDAVGKKKVDLERIKLNIDYSRDIPYEDYRGDQVYGVYFEMPYNNWTLIVEKDEEVVVKNNENIIKIGQYLTSFEVIAIAIIQKILNNQVKVSLGSGVEIDLNKSNKDNN